MKYLISFLLSTAVLTASAQLEAGYRPSEALDMIALSNSFTFLKEEGSDAEIIPKGYERIYDSETIGFDNRFHVYTNGRKGVLVFRGTTANPQSWMVNIYSAMIPAASSISINGNQHDYVLATESTATVHSGYTLSVVMMAESVIAQIKALNENGIYDILITGHSQGGSLATLFRAYLENLPPGSINAKNNFKTYAFAGPMVGNAAFAAEYNRRFSDKQTSFSIVNPQDAVPSFPSGMNEGGGASPMSMFGDQPSSGNDFRSIFLAALFQHFNDSIAQFANQMGATLLNQFSSNVGEIAMPENTGSYEYKPTGQLVSIEPITLDFSDRKFEEGESAPDSRSYQHKPYIYYRSILLEHFPEQHEQLKRLIPPGM